MKGILEEENRQNSEKMMNLWLYIILLLLEVLLAEDSLSTFTIIYEMMYLLL
jgi:hypothetical protein